MEGAKTYWSMTEGTFNCLIDHERTIAFKKCILNTVKKDDVVVDMGTGTGVLAMFAADAGAKKVYAVEIDENNIKTLKKNFEINSYKERIEIIKGDVRKIEIPEKIDVVVGEMIATGLIEELQIPAMNNILKFARDKENIKVVLNKYESYIDLVYNNDSFFDKKFKVVRYEYADEDKLKSDSFSERAVIASVDFSKRNEDVKVDKKVKLEIQKSGTVNGLRISSKTIFYDGSFFDYSFAYSYPIVLPLDDYKVEKGDVFLTDISYRMCEGFNTLKYSVKKIKNK